MDKHAQKTALRLGVSADSVRAEFRRTPTARPVVASEESFETAEIAGGEIPRPSAHELWLLKLIFKQDTALEWLVAHLDTRWIVHPTIREVVGRRMQLHQGGEWHSLGLFLDQFDSAETRGLITEAAAEERQIPNIEQQFADVVLRIRNQFFDRQLAELTQQLSQPALDEEGKVTLLRQQQELRLLKRQPLAPLSPGP